MFPDLVSDIEAGHRLRSKSEDVFIEFAQTEKIVQNNEESQNWKTSDEAINAVIMEQSSQFYLESQQNSNKEPNQDDCDKLIQKVIDKQKLESKFDSIVKKSSIGINQSKNNTNNDKIPTKPNFELDNSEKLYFARLRVRLLIFDLTYAQLKKCTPHKSLFYLIIQFHVLKHGCALYEELTDKLSYTESNPFGFKSPERWENFVKTDSFLNMAKIFWTDADLMIKKFDRKLVACEELLEICAPKQKAQLGVYVNTINDRYSESEWYALDILLSSTIVNVIHKKKADEKVTEKRIE